MKRFSIRWRMTFWNTAAFAVVLTVFGLLVYELLSRIHYDQVDRTLKTRFQELVEDERLNANPEDRFRAWTRKLSKSMDTSGTVLDAAGNVVAQSDLSDTTAMTYPDAYPTALHDTIHFDVVTLNGTGRARRLTGRVTAGGGTYTVMLMAELEHLDEEMRTVLGVLAVTIPVTLAVAAGLGYWLARKSLAPVDQLRQLADEITAEHLDRRLPIANSGDELGALARTINSMISRLERSFGEVRRFTADASHELRTPISVIHSEAEMGLRSSASLADAQNRLTSILEECNRLTSMTDQLLALCREDAGVTAGATTPIHLAALVNDAVETMQPSANAKCQKLSVTCDNSLVVSGDEQRLRRVFYNLLDNAIKYTPDNGVIQVMLERQGNDAVITIQDNGAGIPAEDLPHVFERFYRAHREVAECGTGAGLGLSIAMSIVVAHHGRIEVESEVGCGTTFRVYFPIALTGSAAAGCGDT